MREYVKLELEVVELNSSDEVITGSFPDTNDDTPFIDNPVKDPNYVG